MIQKAGGYASALAAILALLWGGLTLAMDDRYVKAETLTEAVQAIRADRIKSDIRAAELRLAVATMEQAYAEGDWVERRQREREIIEAEIQSLERELEGTR